MSEGFAIGSIEANVELKFGTTTVMERVSVENRLVAEESTSGATCKAFEFFAQFLKAADLIPLGIRVEFICDCADVSHGFGAELVIIPVWDCYH